MSGTAAPSLSATPRRAATLSRDTTRRRRHHLVLAAWFAVAGAGSAPAAHAQIPVAHAGIVFQNSDFSSESGWAVGIEVPIPLTPHWTLAPGVEYVRTQTNLLFAVCVTRPGETACRGGRGDEEVAYVGTAARYTFFTSNRLQPFLEGGVAGAINLHALGVGERRLFPAPQLGGGVNLRTGIGTVSLALRWRSLTAWAPDLGGSHSVLRISFSI